jgi:hypothetical protein
MSAASWRRAARVAVAAAAACAAGLGVRADAAATAATVAPAGAPRDEDDATTRFHLRAATCAAALEIDQRVLVDRARAGTPGLREDLVHVTVLGFTFVGVAYQRGLRNPRAQSLLDAARVEQKALAPRAHEAVAAGCRAEAAALFDGVGAPAQWLLTNRANARVDRFLAAPR